MPNNDTSFVDRRVFLVDNNENAIELNNTVSEGKDYDDIIYSFKKENKLIFSMKLASSSLQLGGGFDAALAGKAVITRYTDSEPSQTALYGVPVHLTESKIFNYNNVPYSAKKSDGTENTKVKFVYYQVPLTEATTICLFHGD